ncbi:uncharacterized protein LOC110178625 [Drosophila serrata]|uniref:uncharacterized protein LOC110178625 n=1 Tax=Drosophila serrata TaxID=7274 RepID=UPI000A1D3502|nr:uncharacterized protein LOC110178625 [Drosophila serrata]
MGSEKQSGFRGNLFWMMEFVVDDMLITRQNKCAPEEYPTCVEITFRSSIYLCVCDREYGSCVNPTSPQVGKCVMFTLDSPVTDEDKLYIHVYKKRSGNCKYLLGMAEMQAKPIFDRVKKDFDAQNLNWEESVMYNVKTKPRLKKCVKANSCSCYGTVPERQEQYIATSELTKRMLPLFNQCKMQTGNLVLLMRVVCSGPSIVSSFEFNPPKPKCPCLGCS